MSSREQPSRLNFTNTRGRGGRLRPDLGNRFYFRGKGGASTTRPALNSPPEPELKKGLDTTRSLGVITAPARPAAPDHFPIENVKYVASYHWIDAEKPTIVVPGAMLSLRYVFVLISVINSLQVRQPYGLSVRSHSRCSLMVTSFMSTGMMIARNCPNIRCCHFWPLRTRYIARRRPHLSTGRAVDVIADRNSLRKLLRWLNPSPGREVRDFRIDVQLVGDKTLVLCRWETPTSEVHTNHSFGHAFEAAMTHAAPDCPSSGHQRAITYVRLLLFSNPLAH
jgi:hypothetical protein